MPTCARPSTSWHDPSDFTLDRLFAHEHGLYGDIPAGDPVTESRDPRTGRPVISLYRPGQKIEPEIVDGLDAALVDMVGNGCRYSTVPGTTLRLLGACHAKGIPLYILDRPNPLGGRYEGNRTVAQGYRSLVSAAPVPIRHGLTLGELALLAARENGWEDGLEVVPIEGWHRSQTWPDLGRPWIPGSPNTNGYEMARLYPGTCLIEGTNLSEGRGTAFPFQQIGAPWLDAWSLADRLQRRLDPGVWCRPVFFRPTASKHEGAICQGVMVHLDPQRDVAALPPALHLLSLALEHPESRILEPSRPEAPCFLSLLAGDDRLRRDLLARRPVPEIIEEWNQELADWEDTRNTVSLYPD